VVLMRARSFSTTLRAMATALFRSTRCSLFSTLYLNDKEYRKWKYSKNVWVFIPENESTLKPKIVQHKSLLRIIKLNRKKYKSKKELYWRQIQLFLPITWAMVLSIQK
jgi:hypothetical protein